MKILVSTTVSGTINTFLVPYLQLYKERGYTVHILAKETIQYSKEVIDIVDHIHNIDMDRNVFSIKNLKSFFMIRRILRREKYDIINTHTPVVSTLLRILPIKNAIIIYTAHGFHFTNTLSNFKEKFIFLIEKLNSRNTDCIITINQSDYELAQQFKNCRLKNIRKFDSIGYDFDKLLNAKEIEPDIRSKLKISQSDFLIFYAAELNKNKNQMLLFRIMKEISNQDIKLVLAGDGNERAVLENYISKHKLNDRIFLLGRVNYIPDILRTIDIVVASSKREGLPFNLLEALAYNRPVIATAIRGHSDVVVHGNNGFLIPENDINCFVEKIKYYYNIKEKKISLILDQKDYIKKFSIEIISNRMGELLDELITEEII